MNKKLTFIVGMAAAGLATAGILAGCGESKLYKITFFTGTDQIISPTQIEWGQIPTLPSDPVRTGYTFTGWYTDATTTNKYVVAEVENDINLYAGWSVNAYTVSFNLGYDAENPAPITGNYGTAFAPDFTVTRPYFTFDGWYYDQDFKKPYKSTDTIPGENITMYAKWIANSYKISFNKNLEAATGTMDDWNVSQISVNNKLPANAFKATGMDFVGWALEPNGEVVYGDQAVVTNIESNKDFTLYAKWAVKQLSAEFFATDSKTGRTVSVSKTAPLAYGAEIPVPAEDPTLIGHEFKGWGKMELTSDVQANIAKEYFQSLGGGVYLKANLNDKDNIAGKGYYEVKAVSMIQERINENNNYYAIFNRVKTNIKFVSGLDGSEITTSEGYFGTTIALPEKPAVPGYKASYWATDEACEEAFIGTTINFSSSDMTLYLKYVIGEYTLNYSLSDNTMEHDTFHYGDVLNIDPIAKEGYVFKTWNTAKDGSGTSYKKGDALPDNDLTLYPVYEIKKFNIVFNAGGVVVSEKLVDFGGDVEYPANPVKEGYNFDGWFEDTIFETPFNEKVMPNREVENNVFNLYGKFTARSHNISFNTDGGSSIESKLNIFYGTSLSSIKPIDPVKNGYTFIGWKEANGRLVDFATETMGDKDLNLVAIWKANNVDFKVSYWGTKLGDASVNVAIGDPHEITVSSYTDDAYSITSAPEIEGFTFHHADSIAHVKADGSDELKVYYTRNNVSYTVEGVGDSEIVYTDIEYGSPFGAIPDTWYKTGKAMSFKVNGVDYADLASYVIKGGEVISVSYEDIPFGIRFIGNSGLVEGKDSVSHEYAYEDLVEFPTEVSKIGYTFKEWNTKADGSGTTINPEGYTMPAEAIDLYAIWTINQYTVDFVDEVGGPHTSVTADYGSTITIPVPSKAGYTFKGFTNKDGEELAADATTYTMPVDGDTLTANWVEHTLTFEFVGNGATSGSMEDQVIKFSDDDADKKLNANQFVKEGHAFKGWSLDAKATSVDVVDEASYADFDFEAESSEITLYAVWEIQSYKLTLNYGNGSDPVVTEHVYGSVLNAPELPTWEGHTFKGWYTKDASDKYTRYSFDRMPGEDLELFALWSETKYEVRFMSDGGSYVAPWKITNGQTLDGNSLATPTKTGYEFAGWFTKNGADGDWGVQVTDATLSSYTINNADIVFYAKWTEKTHTITYYNSDSSVYNTYGGVKYGETLTVPADPTDSGKTFLGWYEYDPATGTIGAYHDFTVDGLMKDSDINLIAKFDEAVYTISFYDENGNLIYSVPSNAADTSFLVYIQNLVKAQASYETIYDAILKAVESQVTGGASGSINEITAVITYATLGGKSMPELFAVAQMSQPGQTEQTAGYAAMTLGAATIATDGNSVLVDAGTTAVVLQTLDPTAINAQLTAMATKAATDPVYGAAYQEIYNAAMAALPAEMGGSNDATKITALATYAGVVNELVVNQGLTTAPQLITYFANTQGADLSIASATITKLATNMAYADNPAYYNMIAEQGAAGIDTISMNTTAFLTEVSTTYKKYEANAYNPTSSDPNKYFDGWTTSISTNPEERYINNFPSFVSKASQTSNVQTYSSSNTTASFNWDAVDGAYGYKVRIEVNGAYKDTVTVRTNDIKIEGLSKGDTVTLSITTLLADSAGNLKETSKEYTATSVVDGSTLKVEAKSLESDPVEFNYIHTTENDIGKVSKFGDYYYLSEDDEGVQTYTFFTNTTYTFGGRPLTIVTPGAGITEITHGESGDAIVTKGSTGMFKFTLDGVEKFGIVKSIPDLIASGSNFEKVENITMTNNTRSAAEYGSHDYLGEVKSTYKVGAAATHAVTGSNIQFVKEGEQSYYNGFKFDVDTLATSGSRMAMDRNYKFEKLVDGQYVEVSNPDRLFFYDAEQDAFFFKATNNVENDNLGVYRVTITPKADIKEGEDYLYINTDVPDKIKQDATKMARLNKQVVFELTNGVNVYTSDGLRKAFAEKSTSVINIQTNIEADYAANAVAYVPWALSFPQTNNVRKLVLGSKEGVEGMVKGDVDIVDGSAVMSTVEGVGPQIWVVDNVNPVFHDKNGVGYAYSASGTYAIESCKWVQNFDEGKFKTIGKDHADLVSYGLLGAPHYLSSCQCYSRAGKGNVELTVNGNYFSIDGSKIPFTRSNVKNTAGGTIATYEIQSLQTQIFSNSSDNVLNCNDMTVICNTSNNSSILDEKTQNVSEIMRMTSGGMSAFRSARSLVEGLSQTQVNLNSVNIYNSLIAMYADCGISASYVHVKNTWANGVYCWASDDETGTTVSLDHTVIESCGGCAVHLDDMEYGLGKWGHITNPKLHVNLDTCTIENFVSGDEQWFKGYSMEVVALGLKSTINSQLAAANKTIIREMVNPVTGLAGEYMNWVFFDKTEEIANQGEKDPADIMCNVFFDNNFFYNSAFGAYVKMDLTTGQPYVGPDGNLKVLQITDATGTPLAATDGAQPQLPSGGDAQCFIAYADISYASYAAGSPTPVITKQYLYFRQSQAPFGWIQGMLEAFDK